MNLTRRKTPYYIALILLAAGCLVATPLLAEETGPVCGDGKIEGDETCDGGDNKDGFCNSNNCKLDVSGYGACTESPSLCIGGTCMLVFHRGDNEAYFYCLVIADRKEMIEDFEFTVESVETDPETSQRSTGQCIQLPTKGRKLTRWEESHLTIIAPTRPVEFQESTWGASWITHCQFDRLSSYTWQGKSTFGSTKGAVVYPLEKPTTVLFGDRTKPTSDALKFYTNVKEFIFEGTFKGDSGTKLKVDLNAGLDLLFGTEVLRTNEIDLVGGKYKTSVNLENDDKGDPIPDGTYFIRIEGTKGGEKVMVDVAVVVLDRQAPAVASEVVVQKPSQGQGISLAGKAEAYATVIVRIVAPDGEKLGKEVIADVDGAWEFSFDATQSGTYSYSTEVVDRAGNSSGRSETNTFEFEGLLDTSEIVSEGCSATSSGSSLLGLLLAALAMVGGARNRRCRKQQ